jgi:hypothetical protein
MFLVESNSRYLVHGFFAGYELGSDGKTRIEVVRYRLVPSPCHFTYPLWHHRRFVFGAAAEESGQRGFGWDGRNKSEVGVIKALVHPTTKSHTGTADEIKLGGGSHSDTTVAGLSSKERMEIGVATREGEKANSQTFSGTIIFYDVLTHIQLCPPICLYYRYSIVTPKPRADRLFYFALGTCGHLLQDLCQRVNAHLIFCMNVKCKMPLLPIVADCFWQRRQRSGLPPSLPTL